VINVPTDFLTSGDYQLKLTGISSDGHATDLGLYPFQVIIR
jgi:methionine-rich copper-binding protein CopC